MKFKLLIHCTKSYKFVIVVDGNAVEMESEPKCIEKTEYNLSCGGGHENPLQYSCLGNPVERATWRPTVHGVTKSQAQLSE